MKTQNDLSSLQGAPLSRAPLAVLGVGALAVVLALFFIFVLMPLSFGDRGGMEFIIIPGQSLGATARELAERDLVVSRLLFVSYSILTGHERDFKAGRYILPEHASIKDLVKIFSEGRSEPEDIEVTIPEGSNVADIGRILAEAGLARGAEFIRLGLSLEGFLFPDTYRFPNFQFSIFNFQTNPNDQNSKPETVNKIIQKMRDNFDNKTHNLFYGPAIEGIVENIDVRPTIIIASILEKEVQTEEDMRLVAGIISKRLELGMPLQIDATVAYGVCYPRFLEGKYCDVSRANIVDNLKVDSEYNTYVRKDLPIGPISNPGLRAIGAALNPQASGYLYYLSAKDGTTIFSKTATEHERNRAKYLK